MHGTGAAVGLGLALWLGAGAALAAERDAKPGGWRGARAAEQAAPDKPAGRRDVEPVPVKLLAPEAALLACTADGFEEDDDSLAATPIAVAECQDHNHCEDATDWLAIAAVAGETYTIETCCLGPSCDTTLTVYDPALTEIDYDDDGGDCDTRASVIAFTATQTDTYYVDVERFAGTFGDDRDYNVCLKLGCGILDAYEEDDNAGQATTIAGGDCQTHNHCDDETDWLSFDGVTGTFYLFDTCNNGNSSDTLMRVYDPSMTLIMEDDNSGGCDAGASEVGFVATQDGPHFVELRQADGAAGVEREYRVCMSSSSCMPDTWEEDDDTTTATLLAPGDCQDHNHCRDASDWFQFDAVAGETYSMDTCNLGAESDTILTLWDPTMTEIDTDDDGGDCDFRASAIVFTASISGAHFMEVRQFGNDPGDDREYSFCLQAGCTVEDSYEPDDDAASAAVIDAGDCQSHQHCDDANDWLQFDALAGGYYQLDTCNYDSSDTLLRVYDPSLALIMEDDNGGDCDAGASLVGFTATQTGVHYAELVQADGMTGIDRDYEVCFFGADCSPDAYEEDDDSTQAAAIQPGECQEHSHCRDGSDWLLLDALVGETYDIYTCNLGPDSDTVMTLYDSTLNQIDRDDDGGDCDTLASAFNFTPGVSGSYYIEVTPFRGPGDGREYRVCVALPSGGPTVYESLDPANIVNVANAVGPAQPSPHRLTPGPEPMLYYEIDDGAGSPPLILIVKAPSGAMDIHY